MKEYYFYNGRSITVYTTEGTFTFLKEDNLDRFNQVHTLCQEGRFSEVAELTLSPKAVNAYCAGSQLSISPEGIATIDDEVLPSALSEVIVNLYKEGAPIDCFVNFWNKLKLNPSYKSVQRLYEFIEKNNITLLPDGDILLYRVVKRTEKANTFVDLYTGTMKQSISETISLPRNQVDDNNEHTCSVGLHVCAFSYIKHYGSAYSGQDAVVNVSVNPTNVVSIPMDYNCAKIRVCEFTILEENTQLTEIRQTYYNNLELESSYDEDDEDDYNEEWDDVEDDNDEDY
jgi:hypothetical protein